MRFALIAAVVAFAQVGARAADAPKAVTVGKVIERVVAVVNEEIILDTEVEQWAAPNLRQGVDYDSPEGTKIWDETKRKALDQLIDSKLEAQQAAELKLSVSNEEIDRAADSVREQNHLDEATFREALKQQGFTIDSYRKTIKRQLLELKVLNTAVRSRVSVSDDEIKAYYQQNERALGGDKQAHLRQILIAVSSDASPAEADRKKRVAQKVLDLARGGTSFVELAKKYSDDELTKNEGGDLGFIGHGVLQDEIENAVASMDAGDLRGPVRTARGWLVLQLVERKAGDLKPFDEVKEALRKQLYDQQVEKATQAWLRELRKKAHLDIRL